MWRTKVHRSRVEAPAEPCVLLPGRPLADPPPAGAAGPPPAGEAGVAPPVARATKHVRFVGATDPAASCRTCDPFLAGARYQRLLRAATAIDEWGARRCDVRLRELAARPRTAFPAH